uniref:HNH endonuclease n=1 Tax=Scandinavium goeteborgense TaxID=1851514 RepID=UPI00135C72A5|nr:HNH endonuclease [Scandinavium goeteborgense]
MSYFYAYHGPANSRDFDYRTGYGIGVASKLSKVSAGDRVFVIQHLNKNEGFMLCGLFEVVGFYHQPENSFPHRVRLEDISQLDAFIPLNEQQVSEQLPVRKGTERWSNFQRHFCRQGASFAEPLSDEVVSVLLSLITPAPMLVEMRERRADGLRMVKIRRDQPKFRAEVMRNWEGRCAITNSSLALEACHIESHASGGLPDIRNGIALAADLHKLFDSGNLSFCKNRVILSEAAQREPRYADLHLSVLRKPLMSVELPESGDDK